MKWFKHKLKRKATLKKIIFAAMLLPLLVIAITSCTEDEDNFCEVTVVSGEGGTATIYPNNPTNKIVAGWWVKVTATPEKDYRFVNWTVNGKEVSRDNPYKATINTSTQFKANFKDKFTVKVLSSEGGKVKASQEGEVLNGTQVAFTATPNEGYGFVNWTVNGEVVSTKNSYTATITEDIEIKANFATYKVTIIAGEGGTAKASNTQVGHNAQVTLTATPQEGYSFVNWTVNGVEVSTANPYRATITANTEFKANFISYKVTVVSGEGGSATASKTQVAPNGQVTLTVTPNEDYRFVNWTVNGSEVSTANPYTATITANTEFKANFIKNKENGHEYVDLGLSVKWATCNVGATTPEEYGEYFSWGEINPKITYTWDNYYYHSYLPISLPLQEDAARVNWGGCWRMPTKAEQDELRNNCTWSFVTQNGVNGCKAVSKKNANSIFFPLAGFREDNRLVRAGEAGHYRSSSRANHPLEVTYLLLYENEGVREGKSSGRCGFPVRAVCE